MNKKDYAILSRLEDKIDDLGKKLKAHHNQGISALYISPFALGISLVATAVAIAFSNFSPIWAVMILFIGGAFTIVYSACQMLRQQRSVSAQHQKTRKPSKTSVSTGNHGLEIR